MKLIKRIPLKVEPEQAVDVPYGEVLSFGMFNDMPCVWVLTDSDNFPNKRRFVIVADGKEVPQHLNKTKYIGMFEEKAKDVGKVVCHVFETT